MKKIYETPAVEKVNFDYKNQVVASNNCRKYYGLSGQPGSQCQEPSWYWDGNNA